ncbi:L,D-transpeptidase [Dictyobacter kobayashii]|uniref:L,D-TPase catalytic domain-containing protein n=1 Tax=Dictyobacter kobayashii TaxID=2014872 RepID=A0A402AKV6_9CHLR|nr:L,D-transpeptidase [Dictyobacter kobayashii]GCE19752.1 hypothetical protein KDK_35520 [Dictyobacter kobayashii]
MGYTTSQENIDTLYTGDEQHAADKSDGAATYTADPDATQLVSDPDKTIKRSAQQIAQLYARAVAIKQEQALAANAATIPVPSTDQVEELLEQKKARPQKNRDKTSILSATSLIVLVLIVLLLAFEANQNIHDPRYLQRPQQKKAQLDQLLSHAQAIGVPEKDLAPLRQKEDQTSTALPWFSPSFYLQPAAAYQAQATQYSGLQQQLSSTITTATQQLQTQAQQDLQSFQVVVSRINMQPIGNSNAFTQRFSADQLQLETAREPNDYLAISNDAHASIDALNTLEVMAKQLATMHTMLDTMQQAGLNTNELQKQYQQDINAFNNASDPTVIQQLHTQLTMHYQAMTGIAIQNYPAVSQSKLQNFSQQITTLKNYKKDTTRYQRSLQADTAQVANAQTTQDRLTALLHIDSDIASMQQELANGEAHGAVAAFHREVNNWAKDHLYHDTFDDQDYAPDSEYMSQGIGSILDADLNSASSEEDFRAVTLEAQNALFNLHLLEDDSQSKTPYNQAHTTDIQALNHYKLTNKQVLMISLNGQAMRLYQNGHLQRAFQVVTGSPQRPSLPGVWPVLDRKSPTVFISKEPKGSPYWFAPTPIQYAILYHYGGDFIHDAYWRATFGPGTQYPHQDTSGNTPYNYDGSHGCINMTVSDMAWIYNHTNWQTVIVIY